MYIDMLLFILVLNEPLWVYFWVDFDNEAIDIGSF